MSIRNILPEENIERIAQLGRENKTVLEIERETGHTRDTVCRWLKHYDIEALIGRHKKFTKSDMEFLKQHYNVDMTAAEIGKVLGHSKDAILQRVYRGFDLTVRRVVDDDEVRKLHNGGKTTLEIAEILDFHKCSIRKSLQRMGLRPNVKNLNHLKGQIGEDLAEVYFENRGIKVLQRGTTNSVCDFIVSFDENVYAVNVKNPETMVSFSVDNLKNLRKFGIPVILVLVDNEWFWMEEVK